MDTSLPYYDFGAWLRQQFPWKVQKISVDGGFSCPNRDGTIASGGCTFCDNRTFNPSYCRQSDSIRTQLEEGKAFFSRKYPDMRYLAYFQAYSNTYAPLDVLRRRYEEALSVEGVVGLVIGTRPDCIDAQTLDYLESLNRQTFLLVEYGVESLSNNVLQAINRGHTAEVSKEAIYKTAERGILTGAHMILGLPGESSDDYLQQATELSSLPLHLLKLHQLQIVKGTKMAQQYAEKPFPLFEPNEYIGLIANYLERLRADIVVDRFVSQSPPELVLAPKWGLKNHEFSDRLRQYMQQRGMYQGRMASSGT